MKPKAIWEAQGKTPDIKPSLIHIHKAGICKTINGEDSTIKAQAIL